MPTTKIQWIKWHVHLSTLRHSTFPLRESVIFVSHMIVLNRLTLRQSKQIKLVAFDESSIIRLWIRWAIGGWSSKNLRWVPEGCDQIRFRQFAPCLFHQIVPLCQNLHSRIIQLCNLRPVHSYQSTLMTRPPIEPESEVFPPASIGYLVIYSFYCGWLNDYLSRFPHWNKSYSITYYIEL